MIESVKIKFNIKNKVSIVTGGAGLLGEKHIEAIAEMDGIPIIFDIDQKKIDLVIERIEKSVNKIAYGYRVDITKENDITKYINKIIDRFGKIDILINNACIDSKISSINQSLSRLEEFPLERWNQEISVGLTGAFLCSRIIGQEMVKNGGGVILNIASDLGLIAPDQRLYRKSGGIDKEQPVKPVSYSVIKHGLIGLTKYLSTYWADKGIRCNALCPGGVFTDQSEDFVNKLIDLIPMGRMANIDEYKAAIIFLISDASSYMNGANLTIDGGRSAW